MWNLDFFKKDMKVQGDYLGRGNVSAEEGRGDKRR
jgi:hypothetical protein